MLLLGEREALAAAGGVGLPAYKGAAAQGRAGRREGTSESNRQNKSQRERRVSEGLGNIKVTEGSA